MQKILVLDDTASLRKAVEKYLTQQGYAVVAAGSGSDGLILVEESKPDLVLTDAVMPGLDGHSLCRVIKRKAATKHIPVVIMTGEMLEENDVVAGLEGGADDYVIKPFTMKVLLARIRAVLRRYEQQPAAKETLKKFGIELDAGRREVRVDGKRISLARKEFDLLALLLSSQGRVLSANYLLETVWGYDLADYNDPHTIETHISGLRRKLGKAAKHLVNVRGAGYKLEE
ncbi:MAG: response regulator transcription factor [Elusimicrobiota bacterium]